MESLVQPIPNLEKWREREKAGRETQAMTQRHCPLIPPQVLPAPQVLALQHRRIQPISSGRRWELPLQQAPQGTSPRAWNLGAGLGVGSRSDSRHPFPVQLLDPPECGNGFVEAGEECDCGSVQVSDQCQVRDQCQADAGAGAREGLGGEGAGSPASLPFSPRPSGVQPRGRELLQEMHPDS